MSTKNMNINHLLSDLISDDENKRVDAAFELAEAKDERAVDGLIEALHNPIPRIRSLAVFALAEIGNSKAMEPIISLLNDPNAEVRARAGWALGKIGNISCLPVLGTALKASIETDAHLCHQLVVALADIGGVEAVTKILPAFQSSFPEVRIVAAEFLGYVGDKQTKNLLSEILKSETNKEVQSAIVNAIIMIENK